MSQSTSCVTITGWYRWKPIIIYKYKNSFSSLVPQLFNLGLELVVVYICCVNPHGFHLDSPPKKLWASVDSQPDSVLHTLFFRNQWWVEVEVSQLNFFNLHFFSNSSTYISYSCTNPLQLALALGPSSTAHWLTLSSRIFMISCSTILVQLK